ncbi:hypothetical protein GYMLUDRAFT_48445 [Collybiopsis luxurians FD-317 M1]|uniref:Uncharacterized protein n=1 Tax=Collybiopsis luxurians FD-317 M1 TaxID=944289 RepID=A0A0D0C9Q9_9AGAR|nr:hypothetical protein GYMLUDRAFT_48445 [Collybiopsis luxurians FD-317 M1]
MLRSNNIRRQPPLPLVVHVRQLGHVPTIQESTKVIIRRIRKAERDERMDLTNALTPVRSYMGGFTRPTEIRASKWFPGGEYAATGKQYEEPSAFAYEPHTVFLLESRYDIKYGVGRKDHPAHIVAVCRTADFEKVLQMFNSDNPPSECIEFMDNARWPFLQQKRSQPVKWWDSQEERQEVLQDLEDNPAKNLSSQTVQSALQVASQESEQEELLAKKEFRRHLAQTAAVAARVSEEQKLTGTAYEIRTQQHKVPFELEFDDGTVAHPSGFVPPTPADKQQDPEYHLSPHPFSRVASELRRLQTTTVNEHHSDSLVPRIEQWKALKERQEKEGTEGLMSTLTTGIISGVVSANTKSRDAKIPTEISGVHDNAVAQPAQHASGFVPPTASMARGGTDARTSVVKGKHSDSQVPEAPERPPTFASGDSTVHYHSDKAVLTAGESESGIPTTNNVDELRSRYFELIKEEPFWRPLIALTVSTRPIAKTLARLSRGLSKGVPFFAAVDPEDRKAQASFASRLRSLRVTRMRTIATEMAQLMAGARGGPIGVRFDEQSRGRGIDGEGLDEPIPWNKRVIGVAIGKWYPLADELAESFKIVGDQEVAKVSENGDNKPPFLIYQVDDRGQPVGENVPELPWSEMDKMNDAVREGLQARAIVNKMERAMAYRHPTKRLSVKLAHKGAEEVKNIPDVMRAIGDIRNPITIRFVSTEETRQKHSSPRENEVWDAQAIAALKERVERFYAVHRENIALATTTRAAGVIYPPVRLEGPQLVESHEEYELSREEEQWVNKNQPETDEGEEDDEQR